MLRNGLLSGMLFVKNFGEAQDPSIRNMTFCRLACSLLVTVQVINHGLSGALMQDAMQMCREFFALPMIEKAMCSMKTSSGIGHGRRFAVKERAKVDWVDRLGFWSATEVHRKR